MKQKYTILKDVPNHQLIIREYAELDKDVLSLLCEETYADQTIQSVIKSGKESLISALRTKNLYPPVTYADKIADAVIALYGSGDKESADLLFDDVEREREVLGRDRLAVVEVRVLGDLELVRSRRRRHVNEILCGHDLSYRCGLGRMYPVRPSGRPRQAAWPSGGGRVCAAHRFRTISAPRASG